MSRMIKLAVVKKKKWVKLILAVIVLVIILWALAAFVPLKNGKTLLTGGNLTGDSTVNNNDLQTSAQQLVDEGDSKAAEQIIRDDPKFGTDWYYHSILADVYLNTNQQDKALETLLDMEKRFGIKHYTIAARIADIYAGKSNSEQAIRYYNKAIEIVQTSDSPTRQWDAEQLNQKLGELK